MIRLAVFDLDGTLAEVGKGIEPEDLELLKQIEDRGVRVAVCSGKPADYLCGFMRQAGLKRPILIGENGAVIQMGVELPPKEFYILPYPEAAAESIRFLKKRIRAEIPNMWFQPNLVGLTPFPKDAREYEIVSECISGCRERLKEVEVYRHTDTFDIIPLGLDKRSGLRFLGERLGIGPEETAAVGDGINDYPMFAYAALAIGIGLKDAARADVNVPSCREALRYLLKETEGSS